MKGPVEKILGAFDFEKAAQALHGCGWRYEGASESPNAMELRKIAERILADAYADERVTRVGQGPLEVFVTVNEDEGAVRTMNLYLCPVRAGAVYVVDEILIRTGHWVSPSVE